MFFNVYVPLFVCFAVWMSPLRVMPMSPSCIYSSVCMSFSVHVFPCVRPFICMSPPCVCPLCLSVCRKSPPRKYVPSVCMSLPCHVFVSSVCWPIRMYIPLRVPSSVCITLRVHVPLYCFPSRALYPTVCTLCRVYIPPYDW